MDTQTPRIVVGYDGSPDADAAAAWAGRMAGLRGEPVVVAIAVDRMESPRRPSWPEPWWDDLEDRARKTLASSRAEVTVEHHRSGSVAQSLVDSAEGATMLVLGSRGHGRIGETLVGSVSQGAARHGRCPVVVVRHTHEVGEHRIVVGVDDSEPSLRALDFACRQSAVTGETVVIFRAWKPLTMPIDTRGNVPPSMSRTLLEEEEALEKSVAAARARHPETQIEGEFVAERPGQALVDASNLANLVVVGCRGHHALAESVLGSVSHQLLHHAHCPVAVVR